MSKQMRAVIFENGTPSATEYANQLFDGLSIETHVVNVYDTRPCTQVLPVRAIPNCAVLLFADTMEEGQEIIDVLKQIDFLKKQDEVQAVVDGLIEAAGPQSLTPELEDKIAATFYGG